MRFAGRPVLGAISGFVLGLAIGLDLTFFRIRVLDWVSILLLPVLGLVLGLLLAYWAPLGRQNPPAAATPTGEGPVTTEDRDDGSP